MRKGVNTHKMNIFVILNLNDEDKKRISSIAQERNIDVGTVAVEYVEFIDKVETLQLKQVNIDFNIERSLLEKKCKFFNLTGLETKILVYYYCDKLKRWEIGNKLGYSEDMISKIKDKALLKIKNKT
jgi:DNA-directed RNA polymerase specialized sigma subunit